VKILAVRLSGKNPSSDSIPKYLPKTAIDFHRIIYTDD
jgi:hypothetical protein